VDVVGLGENVGEAIGEAAGESGGIGTITIPSGGFLMLNGTSSYIELGYPFNPTNGQIEITVWPISSGSGLPANAPAITPGQWNYLTWAESLPELVYLGWDGTNYFSGIIRDITLTDTDSGDTVTFLINSGNTDIELADTGGSYIPEVIFHNVVAGDWV